MLGAYLRILLTERRGTCPNVGDIRGRGLFIGIESVRDRVTRTPFDPSINLNAKAYAMNNGLMVYLMGGIIDGQRGDHVLLAPPFIATRTDLERIVDLLALSILQATDRSLES